MDAARLRSLAASATRITQGCKKGGDLWVQELAGLLQILYRDGHLDEGFVMDLLPLEAAQAQAAVVKAWNFATGIHKNPGGVATEVKRLAELLEQAAQRAGSTPEPSAVRDREAVRGPREVGAPSGAEKLSSMLSMVLELQRKAMDDSIRVSSLLREVLAVSRKLDINDTAGWLEHEMKGYPVECQTPSYRRVLGELKAMNPVRGLIPVEIESFKGVSKKVVADFFSHEVRESVTELESLLATSKLMTIPRGVAPGGYGSDKALYLVLQQTSLLAILNDVRTAVLEWTLRLEKLGAVRVSDSAGNRVTVPSIGAVADPPVSATPAGQSARGVGIVDDAIERGEGFDRLGLHADVAAAARDHFVAGKFRSAVLDAALSLVGRVKERTGRHELDGKDLMSKALSRASPLLRVSDLRNDFERGEQEGWMFLFMGAMQALRNPPAHNLDEYGKEETREMLSFLSLLHRRLERMEVATEFGPGTPIE